jgi:methylase of polypeptide subunit release factors
MPERPRLLDLFCGAGGCAAATSRRASMSSVSTTDLSPRYAGDEFVQADALEYIRDHATSSTRSTPRRRASDGRRVP